MNAKDDRKKPASRDAAQQQQQSQSGEGQQYGEGNYKATRQYNEGLKEHVQSHDIERDAEPRSASEEQEMQEAERIGRSKSRGEGASPDGEQGKKNPG